MHMCGFCLSEQWSEFKANNISVMVEFLNICIANKVLIISKVIDESMIAWTVKLENSEHSVPLPIASRWLHNTAPPTPLPHSTSLHSSWEDCFESALQGHLSFHSLLPERSGTEFVVRRAAWFKVKTRAITRWIFLTESIQSARWSRLVLAIQQNWSFYRLTTEPLLSMLFCCFCLVPNVMSDGGISENESEVCQLEDEQMQNLCVCVRQTEESTCVYPRLSTLEWQS